MSDWVKWWKCQYADPNFSLPFFSIIDPKIISCWCVYLGTNCTLKLDKLHKTLSIIWMPNWEQKKDISLYSVIIVNMLFLLFLTLSLWDFWRWKFFSSFNYSIRLNEEFFGVKASLNLLCELHIIQRGLNHGNLVTWRWKINKLWFCSSWDGFSGMSLNITEYRPDIGLWMAYDPKFERQRCLNW